MEENTFLKNIKGHSRVEGVIALLLAEDAHTVLLLFGRVAFVIQLGQSNCERKQNKKEHPEKFSKILQHLSH